MKILILTTSMGEGHNAIARAANEAFTLAGDDSRVEDVLKFAAKYSAAIASNTYYSIVRKSPKTFGAIYKLGDLYSRSPLPSPIYGMNTLYAKRLYDYIVRERFDAVLTSHLFAMEAMTYIKRHFKVEAKFYGILTDYTCIPFFAENILDGFFMPHPSVARECVGRGLPKERVYTTGIPVLKKFSEHIEKAEARRRLKLPENGKIFTLMTGGIGCSAMREMCSRLLREADRDALLLVLCGRNEELLRLIAEQFGGDERVIPVPFTNKVELYMYAADVVISKPGGSSSTEAAAANVPLIHAMAIPGCETKNMELFERFGMSIPAENVRKAARLAIKLSEDVETRKKLIENQQKHLVPDGGARIVKIVHKNGSR